MTTKAPESAVQFTAHELLALLSVNRGAGEQGTRSMLKLADLPGDADLVRAGFSTLVVRELLETEGEKTSLRGPAKVLAQILTTANLWVDVTVADRTSTSVTFLIGSPGGRVALFIRPAGIVMGVPLAPTVDCTAMALDMVGKNFAAHERDSLVSVRRRVQDGPVAAASIRRTSERGWEFTSGPADQQVTADATVCTDLDEALARLRDELGSASEGTTAHGA